jgi:DNA-binding LytR/AlgR family response regulator
MFWQIYRSTLVNVNAIAGLVRDSGGPLRVKRTFIAPVSTRRCLSRC